jgi:hypothetical protein
MTTTTLLLLLFTVLLLVAPRTEAAKEPRTGINFADKFKGSSLDSLGVRAIGPLKVYAIGKYGSTFLLKMNIGVSATNIATNTAQTVRPRCSDQGMVRALEEMLVDGMPNGCAKGTKLAFSTGGGRLAVTVNEKSIGSIHSRPLAKAFAAVFTDNNAVLDLKPIGTYDDEDIPRLRLITPTRCAAVGAAIGWGIRKLLD